MSFTIGLIRVLTLKDEELLNIHGRIIETMFPDMKVISRCIEDQPKGIYNQESEEIAKPKILKLAKEFEKEGIKAVIVSCAADPAVREARKELKIPIIGAGSAVASLALAYGSRIGVLNLTEDTPKIVRRILGPHLVAEERPEGVRNALDLMTEWGKAAAKDALNNLLRQDVDVIVLACTGYSTIGFAKTVREMTEVPVVDPVIAAGIVTLNILKQKEI